MSRKFNDNVLSDVFRVMSYGVHFFILSVIFHSERLYTLMVLYLWRANTDNRFKVRGDGSVHVVGLVILNYSCRTDLLFHALSEGLLSAT